MSPIGDSYDFALCSGIVCNVQKASLPKGKCAKLPVYGVI